MSRIAPGELSHGTPSISSLANAYARSGNKVDAQKLLAGLVSQSRKNYVSPYYFAVVYVGLGEDEKATDGLEKAYSDRSNGLVFLKVDPSLDHLRSNPRLLALKG
jgi:hypothetical protein